ncbi:glycosyl transferase family 1 [Sphingobacteriales bacterium UPWRP_1]|nr:hypothetical protein BVG80_06350 [Sphingobacteriales bacterium TSM_CSM]PSJ78029.1 glycosyl transferase family 1 [Sphingobacteriales bacterium UPWRP_1]
MHILQLCKKNPYPPADGEAIAILSVTKELHKAGHKVTALVMNTPKHTFNPAQMPPEVKAVAQFRAEFVDTRLKPLQALKCLLLNRSYNIDRFVSAGYAAALRQLLQTDRFDVVQMEGVYLAPYLPLIRQLAPQLPVVMRTHNIEHIIWQRLAAETNNPVKRAYLTLLARQFKAYEQTMLPCFNGLVPISPLDARQLEEMGCKQPMYLMPAGFNEENYPFSPPGNNLSGSDICYLGSLDWLPNQQGLEWIFTRVLPLVRQQLPNATLFVAGRNAPPGFLQQQIPGVVLVGEVPNAAAFLQQHSVVAVPLFSGSGMRVKIIEALALGKPVVCTSVAAEGIACTPGKDLLIANTPEEFANNLLKLLKNPGFCNQISYNARNFAMQHHNNTALVAGLIGFYQQLLTQ